MDLGVASIVALPPADGQQHFRSGVPGGFRLADPLPVLHGQRVLRNLREANERAEQRFRVAGLGLLFSGHQPQPQPNQPAIPLQRVHSVPLQRDPHPVL